MSKQEKGEILFKTQTGQLKLATRHVSGQVPGVFYLCGFGTDTTGTKINYIFDKCEKNGTAITSFDYSGHGASEGTIIDENATISSWLQQILFIFENMCATPQVIVGSSMGGWLALLAACKLPRDLVKGLVLIAPAIDMIKSLIRPKLAEAQLKKLMHQGFCELSVSNDFSLTIGKHLMEDGVSYHSGDLYELDCPVIILQGGKDNQVPVDHSRALISALVGTTTSYVMVPEADHSFSRESDLELIWKSISNLLDDM